MNHTQPYTLHNKTPVDSHKSSSSKSSLQPDRSYPLYRPHHHHEQQRNLVSPSAAVGSSKKRNRHRKWVWSWRTDLKWAFQRYRTQSEDTRCYKNRNRSGRNWTEDTGLNWFRTGRYWYRTGRYWYRAPWTGSGDCWYRSGTGRNRNSTSNIGNNRGMTQRRRGLMWWAW